MKELGVGDRWVEQKEKGQKPTDHLVIVNLQKTPLDDVCSLRIFAKIDDVMVPLMKELGLEIPEWKLQRFMKVKVQPLGNEADLKTMVISAVDVDGINATVFQEVKLSHNGNSIEKIQRKKSEKEKEREELEAREARRALRDAQRAKLRMALKAKKMEQKNREQLANGNTEPISKQKKPIKKVRERGGKRYESGQEFQFHIESSMLESANNDDEQKENENGSNPSHGLVAGLSFFGNFGEPQLLIPLQPFLDNATSSTNENGDDETLEFMCRLTMDIRSKSWNVEPYSCPPYKPTLNHIGRMAAMAKSTKPKKPKNKSQEEREQREAQRASRDAQRAKERMALKAKRMEQRKKEQLLKANNESVAEPTAESKDDDSNLLNGNQPQDAASAPLVLDDIEAPNDSNGVEENPEDDTEISPVHRRPSDDKSPNPYRSHLSENETVSASNDADLVSGDQ